MNNLINASRHIPIDTARLTLSVSPITLTTPQRKQPLELRITAPVTGDKLPVILLSHGHGPSLYLPSKDGYSPLANFYAEQGFVVIQPTHANSKVAGFASDAPGAPLFWRTRVEEMQLILDRMNDIEEQAPAIAGRLDHTRIAAVGHSAGAHTVGMLLGARLTDPKDTSATDVNLLDPRIKAGVLLAAPGNGGDDLSEYAREHFSELNPDFTYMTTPTLVVFGDADVSPHLTSRGADWHADPYHFSPGSDYLLTLFGAKHGLGGIAGYDAKETDDEDPDRLAVTQRMTSAYLHSALYKGNTRWSAACKALKAHAHQWGQVDSK